MPDAKRIVLAVTLAEQGGVQEFLLRLGSFLAEQGHNVTILAGEGSWLFPLAHDRHIPIRRLTHLRRAIHPWHDLLAFFELRRVLKELQPDAIHLNSTKMGILGSLAARAVGIKTVVYRIGGWVFLEPLSTLTRRLYLQAERLSARWKDVIICVHPEDERLAHELNIIPRKKLTTIPNGIDLPLFDQELLPRARARTELALTDSKNVFVFGTIANFFPAKDLLGYLDACALIHQEFPSARFLIIGDGQERLALEKKLTRLGLVDVCILVGRRSRAGTLLRAFDAFVLPSAKEGMSWALLEAMAAGLPCLATKVGANSWLLDAEAGWLTPPQDPASLAQHMKDIFLQTAERTRRGERARERIKRDFPFQKTLQDNENALID